MIIHLWLSNKRVLVFLLVTLCGGLASMAKTLGIYSEYVLYVESTLGGDWVLHLSIALLLGFSASWAMEKAWLETLCNQCHAMDRAVKADVLTAVATPRSFRFMPYSLMIFSLVMVSVDEALQGLSSVRELSATDWMANVSGVLLGSLFYHLLYCNHKEKW